MDLPQLKQEAAKVPATSPARPLLVGIVEELERQASRTPGDSTSQEVAALRQEIATLKAPAAPSHPYGPCNNPQCQSCVQAAQEAVLYGRQSFMGDLDAALAWANRRDIAEIVTDLYGAWEQAGKPQPVGA